MSSVVVFCYSVALVGQLCFGTVLDQGPDGAKSMKFKAPNISDEERHSNFIPEQLKCDACRIVAYQVSVENYCFLGCQLRESLHLFWSTLWSGS